MERKVELQREFIQKADTSRLAEYLYDVQLNKENEIVLIARTLNVVAEYKNQGRIGDSLDYLMLLNQACKYGLSPETQMQLLLIVQADEPTDETKELFAHRGLVCDFLSDYANYRDFTPEANALFEKLKSTGRIDEKLPVPEYRDKTKEELRVKFMSKYSRTIYSYGICRSE